MLAIAEFLKVDYSFLYKKNNPTSAPVTLYSKYALASDIKAENSSQYLMKFRLQSKRFQFNTTLMVMTAN